MAACVLAVTPAGAESPVSMSSAPSVVELFTSQSCSSCPPAEAYLGELAGRADVIALAFHVDYWNDLVAGAAGRWTDPHSDAAWTERQRAYARVLPATESGGAYGGVYTPQVVIDGRLPAVGSDRRAVEAALTNARRAPHLTLALATLDTGKIELRIGGRDGVSERAAEVWLVRFKRAEETKIRTGENRGRTQVNYRIVTGLSDVGRWVFDTETMILDGVSTGPDEGCAILLQGLGDGGAGGIPGPILGAAACPAGAAQGS